MHGQKSLLVAATNLSTKLFVCDLYRFRDILQCSEHGRASLKLELCTEFSPLYTY